MKTWALLVALMVTGLGVTGIHAAPCANKKFDATIPDVHLQVVARGFRNPVFLTHVTGDSDRLFVIEQAGVITVLSSSQKRAVVFLDIRDRVSSGGERGLLSMAFHPDYKNNGLFYVNYTRAHAGRLETVIAEYHRASVNKADKQSERVLLSIEQPYSNHNGGQINFGPDGYLYIGMGDGGAGDDPLNSGQDTSTLLGAILRIDVNHKDKGREYAIPTDNPFVGKPGYRGEIWAYGLRNPWRFSFDALNGDLYAADVGQNQVEEIDHITKGGNYGWRVMEGNICTPGVNPNCKPDKSMIAPIETYTHAVGYSVTGGYVYRGDNLKGLCGVYLYADYVTQRLWGLRYDGKMVTQHRELMKLDASVSSFGEDADHELYIVDHRGGQILKFVP